MYQLVFGMVKERQRHAVSAPINSGGDLVVLNYKHHQEGIIWESGIYLFLF